jgi:hypothetical protein
MGTVKLGRPGVGGCVSTDKHKETRDLRLGEAGNFHFVSAQNPVC